MWSDAPAPRAASRAPSTIDAWLSSSEKMAQLEEALAGLDLDGLLSSLEAGQHSSLDDLDD